MISREVVAAQQPNEDQQISTVSVEGNEQPPESVSEKQMEDWLTESGKTANRLLELGVDPKVAEEFVSSRNSPKKPYAHWRFPRTAEKPRSGVLFLPCSWTDFAYLYVVQYVAGVWRVTDNNPLDCHYDESISMEIEAIRNPNRDEIVIHHACAGHGAGFLEQDFSISIVSKGKLKEELATEEVLSTSRVGGPPLDVDQRSTFTAIPIRNSQSRAIEETRSTVLNGKLTVRRRIFRWDAGSGRYVPRRFSTVEVGAK